MLDYIKRIIQFMLEVARRWGPYFFSSFVAGIFAIASAIAFLKDYRAAVIILLSILVGICGLFSGVALFYDVRAGWKKDHPPPPGFGYSGDNNNINETRQ